MKVLRGIWQIHSARKMISGSVAMTERRFMAAAVGWDAFHLAKVLLPSGAR